MASGEPQRATSPALVGGGVALAAVVVIVAFVAIPDYAWAVVVLLVVCAVAAAAYRMITARGGGDADASDSIPRQEPRSERPLGDTPEAHDELNPHDLPLDNPGRDEAEAQAGGSDGTTRGPVAGG